MTSELETFVLAHTLVGPEPPPSTPSPDPLLGATVDGRYRITERLSARDATLLYRGVQLSIDRPVAIKLLRAERSRDPELMKRLVREAQILTNLNHPNIVGLLDSGLTESGEPYLVLDMIRGTTLEAELARVGRFDVRRACEIAIQLCSALAAAHAVGTVHGNLEPSNIMLLEDAAVRDVVKVLGFGLAKTALGPPITVAGSIMKAPRYLAPEGALSSGSPDPRGDLYSLGCVLYELLTGGPHQTTSPQSPAVDRLIADLVMALLARAPEDRPAATFVLHQLQAWLDGHQARVATVDVDAETVVGGPLRSSDDQPTLHEMPAATRVLPLAPPTAEPIPPIRRVLPPTPLVAQPMPWITRVLPPRPVFPQATSASSAIPPTPLRAWVGQHRVAKRVTMALSDPRAARALVLAALLFVVAGMLLVLAALLS